MILGALRRFFIPGEGFFKLDKSTFKLLGLGGGSEVFAQDFVVLAAQ